MFNNNNYYTIHTAALSQSLGWILKSWYSLRLSRR